MSLLELRDGFEPWPENAGMARQRLWAEQFFDYVWEFSAKVANDDEVATIAGGFLERFPDCPYTGESLTVAYLEMAAKKADGLPLPSGVFSRWAQLRSSFLLSCFGGTPSADH